MGLMKVLYWKLSWWNPLVFAKHCSMELWRLFLMPSYHESTDHPNPQITLIFSRQRSSRELITWWYSNYNCCFHNSNNLCVTVFRSPFGTKLHIDHAFTVLIFCQSNHSAHQLTGWGNREQLAQAVSRHCGQWSHHDTNLRFWFV